MWQLRFLVTINIKQLMRSKINHHSLPTHSHPFTPPRPRKQTWRWTLAVSHGHSDLKKYFSAGFLTFAHLITEHLKGTGFSRWTELLKKQKQWGHKKLSCVFMRFTKLRDERHERFTQRQISFLIALGQTYIFFSLNLLQPLVVMLDQGQKHRTECRHSKRSYSYAS